MPHTAEIIAVGTELLLGNIVNTNAQELSQILSGLGINVFWHTVVGDNPDRLRQALDTARRRAYIILTTGGLCPTYDDLTNGNLNTPQTSCLLNQYDSNGNIIGQFIEVQDCLMFGLSNAIFAAIFFFIVSIGMKFGSRNCKYVPF